MLRTKLNIKNLQNLPSGSIHGKLIKSCIKAPKGWLYVSSDFSALEDRISAILSGDKMKTLEFSQGLDGHSVRSLAFFPEELPELDMNDVKAVNSIKDMFPDIRQKAKAPSFALQYNGTWRTIQKTLGCTAQKAKQIEENYHKLYSGLAEFSRKNIDFARRNGYVECAFGLKLRTPRLEGTIGKELTPEQETEGRSCSNAVTQSYGLLMNRALIEFRELVDASTYRESIRLINTIHDAGYLLVKNDPEVLKWVNDNFIKCMLWQEDPLLKSDDVKMGAELDIGKSWDKPYTLKNEASLEEVIAFMKEHELV